MARIIGKLTALRVDKARQPGMYGDGGGLYLRVTDDGAKNWVFRFMLNGRARWMGIPGKPAEGERRQQGHRDQGHREHCQRQQPDRKLAHAFLPLCSEVILYRSSFTRTAAASKHSRVMMFFE